MVQYFPATEYASRLERAAQRCQELDIDAIIIDPGPDLRYLTGYHAQVLERLIALVVPAEGTASMVLPRMEEGTAKASPINQLDIELHLWNEIDDPSVLVRDLLPNAKRVAVANRMWAVKAFALANAMPGVEQLTAGPVVNQLRMRKSELEIAELVRAGKEVDAVHAAVPDLLRPSRRESEVAADIADLLRQGHETADFVIVGSGPNSAIPHHEYSERELQAGDIVVIDIGGTTDMGYCSDSTRTYSLGEPENEFTQTYAVLQKAQAAAREAVAPGVACEVIDATARDVLTESGLGDVFIHRTGHGIGLETHEEPYIIEGNDLPLEPGMAFSIEPGFYFAGQNGARLEDIVVCGEDAAIVCNHRPRELLVVE